ncbi:tetratricopeptide repeat protein [Thalassotalea hakodatensis]|uniref:tetratricopeptide repeat protein n=1 Tax=Thalassotalea hakodatensis TaxID=3030492 RepID=UPI0025724B01|nr:tetratricopeptide repeat protein [Thalassotalea hakodatensis]
MKQRLLKTLTLRYAFLTISVFNTLVAHALTKSSTDNFKEKSIDSVCITSPIDCLSRIDLELSKKNQSELVKYDLLQYRFVALFNLQRNKSLLEETTKWLSHDNLPIPFKITVYIYHAKSLRAFGKSEKTKIYAEKAITLLKQMNEIFPSPMRLVELANLTMQYGEVQQAYSLLSQLTVKFKDSKNALFKTELHGNLGHAAAKLQKYQEAEQRWKAALYWGDIVGNKQQQGVIRYNLADIYEQLAQLNTATLYFEKALSFSQQAQDSNKILLIKFRLSQLYVKQQMNCQAYQLINSIEKSALSLSKQQTYDTLIKHLKPC